MKLLKQFMIIIAISLIGEVFSHIIPLPVPAGIYGIILMLLLLITGVLKASQIKEVSSFLIEIMPVMFIPAGVGLMQSYDLLAPSIGAYAVIIFVSTIAVMAVSGLAAQCMIQKKHKKEAARDA